MSTTPTPPAPWERIVADVADALIYADREGIIRAWNPAATALFGFEAAEALGQSLDLIIPAHLREAHWRGFDRAIAHGSCGREVRTTRGTHKDGRKLYVDMSFSVVTDGNGQALGSGRHGPGRDRALPGRAGAAQGRGLRRRASRRDRSPSPPMEKARGQGLA
ncbi:PAS sensor protein [Alicycliphilus sp. B1]|nr:PAS sensor protein [Alicycliphilus sp. B1]